MIVKERVFQLAVLLSLINFFIASSLGVLIRTIPFLDFAVNGRFVIHSHSHVAFLGWVFVALMALIYDTYFSGCRRVMRWFIGYLIIIQLSVFGMLVTFPFMGYAVWSIIFSSLHMGASIVFVFYFIKKSLPVHSLVKPFIWSSLLFMALSSIGPLALGPLSILGFKSGFYYDTAIYFYLHFQYNGWFTMAIIGLILSMVDADILRARSLAIRRGFGFLIAGIVLTFLLSLLGYKPGLVFNLLGGFGALIQLAGIYFLTPVIIIFVKMINNRFYRLIFLFALMAMVLKFIAQFISAFPLAIDMAYYNRDLIIAYLHWVLLGFVSIALLGFIGNRIFGSIADKKIKIVMGAFIGALLLSEMVILLKQELINYYSAEYWHAILLGISIVMTTAVFIFLVSTYLKVLNRDNN